MASLGTLGLDQRYVIFKPRFSGSGVLFKILPWGVKADFTPTDDFSDYPFIKSVFMVSLSLGTDFVSFVPYHINDITAIVNNPVRILQNAVANRRNVRDRVSIAWEKIFPTGGSSFVGSPINASVRYLVPAIIFKDDDFQYQNPRGLGQTKVLLALSKTAVGGVINCIVRDGARILGPNNIVFHAQPQQSKYSINEGVSAKQYVVNTLEYVINESVLSAMHTVFNSHVTPTWESVIAPIPAEQQLELILASSVPKSAVAYAFQHTSWAEYIPEKYLNAGLAELSALESESNVFAQNTFFYRTITPSPASPPAPGTAYPTVPPAVTTAPNPQMQFQQGTAPFPPESLIAVGSSLRGTDAQQAPVQQVPMQQDSVQQMPLQQVPVQQVPAQQVPTQVPPQQAPANQAPMIPENKAPEYNPIPPASQQGDKPAEYGSIQPPNTPNVNYQSIPLPTNIEALLDSFKSKLKEQ